MKLLKQKTSGEIYVWDEELAKRDDMEVYVKPEAQSETVQKEQPETEQEAPQYPVEVVAEAAPKPKKKGK